MTLESLRKHIRKNTEFVWSPECEQSFQEVKQKPTSAPILIYYDPVLQVDNIKDGVGAVVMQDGRPIVYALRALTASERKWAQNEMDAMDVLFGVQIFDQYTYGRRIVVEYYHKPLETILQTPRIQIPERRETSYCRHS